MSLARVQRLRAKKRFVGQLRAERAQRRAALTRIETPSTDAAPEGPKPNDFFDDPQGFCEYYLRIRVGREILPFRLWAKQGKLARAVLAFRRVACRSGHKIGKSALAAALAVWWACTRPNALVILTAPTDRQVKKALWKEIRRFWTNSPKLQSIMPEPGLDPETGVRWDDGRELFGFTAKNADAVSGPGGPEVLVIVDEASGVSREVWEALQGIRASGGKVLALGNPTQTSGWFFDAFNEKRDGWELENISSTETPNYIEGRHVIPGLADRDFEQEIADDYGRDSPTYAVRVLGDFPANVANAVIGLGMIEAARRGWLELDPDEAWDGATVDLGVDVARFGDDDSAVSARIGQRLLTPAWFEKTHNVKAVVNGYDAVKLAGLIQQCLRVLPVNGRRVRIKIDSTGDWAGPLIVMLRALQDTGDIDPLVDIIGVNFAEKSSDEEKYPVRRDELWFGARPFFLGGGAMFPDAKFESDVMAATYAPDVKGRNKVEPKKDMKKRLGRSPDRGESGLLAIYEPGSIVPTVKPADNSHSRWSQSMGRGFG